MRTLRLLGLLTFSLMLMVTLSVQAQTEAPDTTPETAVTEEMMTEEAFEGTMTPTTAPTLSPQEIEDCPVLVQEALDVTKTTCDSLANNEVCYGHSTLEAASRPGFADFKFDEPGDIEEVIEMQSLSLSPMDLTNQEWGVILMRVRTTLAQQSSTTETQGAPQTAPDASSDSDLTPQAPVTFVVFGDTKLTAPTTIIEGRLNGNARMRALPSTSSEIVTVLEAGADLVLNGRTPASDWIRVRIINEAGGVNYGWIAADLVEVEPEIDLDTLDEIVDAQVTSESPLNYGPMQAFYFQSGATDAPCEAAPNSGMLIQTPEGQATVTLWIDEVVIELNGTTYVQTGDNGDLTLSSLDGIVSVTANGSTRTAVPGVQVTVPLTADLTAAGVPNDPQPIDPDNLQALPVDLLDTPVTIPDALTVPAGAPAPGRWSFRWDVTEATCPGGRVVGFEASGVPSALNLSGDGTTVEYGNNAYQRVAEGVYQNEYTDPEGNTHRDTLNVLALDRIQGESVIEVFAQTPECTLTIPFTLTLVAGS